MIQTPQITGVQPPLLQSLFTCIRVPPVTGHNRITPHQDFTNFTVFNRLSRWVSNFHIDHWLSAPNRRQTRLPSRISPIAYILTWQCCYRHWTLTLTINLDKYRPKPIDCLNNVRLIHGSAGINDSSYPFRLTANSLWGSCQALYHCGGGKHMHWLKMLCKVQNFFRLKATRSREDMSRAF